MRTGTGSGAAVAAVLLLKEELWPWWSEFAKF